MGRIRALLLILAVSGAAVWLWQNRPVEEDAGEPTNAEDANDSTREDGPQLKGARRKAEPQQADPDDGIPAHIRALEREMASGDADRQDAALKELRALHEKEPFPFEWLLRWALLEIPSGRSNPLVALALAELASEHPEKTRAHLTQILESALGASERKQEAIARLVLTLRGGRYGNSSVLEAEHVPVLIRIYEHEDSEWGIKRELIHALEDLGGDAAPMAPVLMDYVKEVLADRAVAAKEAAEAGISVSWDHVEFDVERLLAGMGDDVVPRLVAVLTAMYAEGAQDEDGFWSDPTGIVASALAASGEAGIEALLRFASDPRERVRSDVTWALREVEKEHADVRAALLVLLQDEDADVRKRAAELLARHGDTSIPALLRALQDPEPGVRRAATKSLSALGVKAADVMAQMLAMLEGPDRRAAVAAAQAIARFGPEASSALPRILARMDTEDVWLRDNLGDAAMGIAPHAPAAVQESWRALGANARRGLIRMLVHLDGPDGHGKPRPNHPDLQAMIPGGLDAEDPWVRVRAAEHIASTSASAKVQEILRTGFTSRDGEIRTRATEGLAKLGEHAADLLPAMISRLESGKGLWLGRGGYGLSGYDENSVLGDAISDLGRYRNDLMFGLLEHENWDLQFAAGEAFDRQDSAGHAWLEANFARGSQAQKKEALDVADDAFFKQGDGVDALRASARSLIKQGLGDPDPHVRLAAVEALRKDEAEGPALVLPVLMLLLDEDDDELVSTAAYRLSRLGAKADPARAQIEARVNHRLKNVATTLRRLLETIDGKNGK
ncbi:MAG: HEAT repeat domain-containing protein [Planctomycetota bacterium]|nr:HEAT repeat domain-containing protein [Planctomycetota bacterium]